MLRRAETEERDRGWKDEDAKSRQRYQEDTMNGKRQDKKKWLREELRKGKVKKRPRRKQERMKGSKNREKETRKE